MPDPLPDVLDRLADVVRHYHSPRRSFDRAAADLRALADGMAEIRRLRDAIREHRDQKADDRCWLDDHKLYSALPEGTDAYEDTLPTKDEFLKSCERYWQQRQSHVGPACPRTIGQLEREIRQLRAERDKLIAAVRKAAGLSSDDEPSPPSPPSPGGLEDR